MAAAWPGGWGMGACRRGPGRPGWGAGGGVPARGARCRGVCRPPPTLPEVTSPVFIFVLAAAHAAGFALDFNEAAVVRMRSDLVFDPADARRDFGYSPRGFRPNAAMFPVLE